MMGQNDSMGLTPKQIVSELDRYIIGQYNAKKMVAIALRNRSRRKNLPEELRDEVLPKNIIMIGPTGVGKTEIARRLSRLAGAPFIKVEASKYTEVGYVGRDVESMVRDLADVGVNIVREEKTEEVLDKAKANAEHKLLDLLLPPPPGISSSVVKKEGKEEIIYDVPHEVRGEELTPQQKWLRNREKMKKQLAEGKLEERQVEIETAAPKGPMVSGFSFGGSGEEMGIELKGLFDKIMPSQRKKMKIPISEAREVLTDEEVENLLDMEKIIKEGLDRSQESGIIFIDEIDKIAGKTSTHGPDVSREGVQRDILPIVEGSTVFTKYGMVKTDHILFIAAGAFHTSKPSDLIPEIQGRFPLRVELDDLGPDEFKRILTEPENALTRQYQELLKTDSVKIDYTKDGIEEIAQSAYKVNQNTENIGARRLYTVMEKIFEEISFEAPDVKKKHLTVNAEYVLEKIKDIVKDQDLSKFIL